MSILLDFLRFPATITIALLIGCGGRENHTPAIPEAVEKEWDIHHAAEREGQKEAAIFGYRDMCRRTPPYIRACFDHARLLFELASVSEAREETRKTVLRFPNNALAQSAIKRFGRSFFDDIEGGIRALSVLAEETRGKECHDTVLFEIARLARSSENTPLEIETLEQLLDRFDRWESQLWDNAAWRLAELHRKTGNREAEKRVIRALLDTRERSRFIGSYTSPFHDDALLRLGEILMEEGNSALALETFMELGGQEKSRLRDEGLLGAARIERALGNDEAACRLLEEILKHETSRRTQSEAKTLSHLVGCVF